MGNQLSPLLAEICMNKLEENIYNHPIKQFLYYFRYIDDISVFQKNWYATVNIPTTSKHPTITFTAEHQKNNSLNFLDLS